MTQQCNICGSITGEHGFSFGERARAAQAQEALAALDEEDQEIIRLLIADKGCGAL